MKKRHAVGIAVIAASIVSAFVIAQPVPQPGLSKVVHDTTLKGSGTNPAPLGLALCGSNQIWKMGSAGGSGWGCQADSTGTGTVTSVGSGSGISGGPITTSGNLAIDPTYTQRRVTGTCTTPNAIVSENQDGTVSCSTGVVDTAGTSLWKSGSTLNLGIAAVSCSAGSGVTSIGSNGTVTCTAIGTVTSVGSGSGISGGPITSTGNFAIDPTYTQRRVTGTCAGANAVQSVNQDGTVSCSTGTTGTVTGTGTTNKEAKWTSTTAIGSGWAVEDGTTWGVPSIFTITEASGNTAVAGTFTGSGAAVLQSSLTVWGNLTGSGTTTVGNFVGTVVTPTTITGTNNDYNPTNLSTATDLYIASSSGVPTITGLQGGAAGRRITLHNVDASNNLLIACNNASSSAANRITGPWGTVNLTLTAGTNSNVTLKYNGTSSRWRVVSFISDTWPAMTVTGAMTMNGNVALGDASADTLSFNGSAATALNMNSHQINGLSNGSVSADAAAFGQIATAVNAAVSGTSGSGARFSGTNTIANAAQWDNGTYTTHNESVDGVTVSTAWSAGSTEVDNYAFPASKRTVVLNSVGASTLITGIAAPSENYRRITIMNNSTAGNCMLVYDDNTNSTITNRIKMEVPSTSAASLCPQGALECVYDPNLGSVTPGRWSCAVTFAHDTPGDLTVDGALSTTSSITTTSIHATGGITSDSSGILSGAGVSAATGFTQSTATGTSSYTNAPSGGDGQYSGIHIEGADDWMNGANGLGAGTVIGKGYLFTFSGAGAGTTTHTPVAGRPGLLSLASGAASSSYAGIYSDSGAVNFGDGKWSYNAILSWPVLSGSATSGEAYVTLIGFWDTLSANQVDGCYWSYDRLNVAAGGSNSGKVNNLECWCSSNSTRTTYLVAGGTGLAGDGSFAMGSAALVAGTYYNLKVDVDQTIPEADFKFNGTKMCQIKTNIPTGVTRITDFGIFHQDSGTTGLTTEQVDIDFTKWVIDLTSARSP